MLIGYACVSTQKKDLGSQLDGPKMEVVDTTISGGKVIFHIFRTSAEEIL